MKVPFVDLRAQHRELSSEILDCWKEILAEAAFIGGRHVDALEREFAEACGTQHCVCVNSGTDALRFIFLALDVRPGDEVITVPNTFIATAEAISQAGATPVFVDIRPDTYNMDPSKIAQAITPKTRGIVPIHLYGQPADMDPIVQIADENGLWVVEDACQAHLARYKGRRVGSIGIGAAFSFYPGKNIGACGEGGAVTTNDAALAEKVRMLRDHGQSQKYYHKIEGFNGRMDAVQAAALRIKLRHLKGWNDARIHHARRYNELLGDIDAVQLPVCAPGCESVYHLYVIQVQARDNVMRALKESGIETGLHYPIPLHMQEAYASRQIPIGSFPVTESGVRKILSLPIFPELSDKQLEYVCECLKKIVG